MYNMFYVEKSLTGEDVVKYIVFGLWENCTLLKVSMLCFLCTADYYYVTGELLYERSLGARELRFVTSLAKIDSNYTFDCKIRAMNRLADGAELGEFARGGWGSQHLFIRNTLRKYSGFPDDKLKDIAMDIAKERGKEDPFYYKLFVHFSLAEKQARSYNE